MQSGPFRDRIEVFDGRLGAFVDHAEWRATAASVEHRGNGEIVPAGKPHAAGLGKVHLVELGRLALVGDGGVCGIAIGLDAQQVHAVAGEGLRHRLPIVAAPRAIHQHGIVVAVVGGAQARAAGCIEVEIGGIPRLLGFLATAAAGIHLVDRGSEFLVASAVRPCGEIDQHLAWLVIQHLDEGGEALVLAKRRATTGAFHVGEQRALVLAAKIGREQVSLGDRSRAQRLHFRARDHELGVVAPGDIGDVLLLAEPQDLPLAAAIQWHDLEHRLHAIGRWHGKGDMLAVRRQRDLGNFRVPGKVHVTGRLRHCLRGCKLGQGCQRSGSSVLHGSILSRWKPRSRH